MKKIISYSVVILLLLPGWVFASVFSKQPFSADLYYQAPGDRERLMMRSYFSEDKMRIDRVRGVQNSGIARLDKDVVWELDHRKQILWEIPLAPIPVIHLLDLDGTTLHRTRMGRERLNGVPCEKLRVRYEDPRTGRIQVATAWFGIHQGIYVRIEKADGTVYNLRNIQMGPQPGHLFAMPRHYRLRRIGSAPGHAGAPPRNLTIHGPPWYGRPPTQSAPPHRPDPKTIPVLRDGRLFPNSDFEDGTLHNWRAKGNAFRFQPTKADNPRARFSKQPSRHQKYYWIGTYEKYGARLKERPGQIQGNRPTGTLTSIPFVITHERIEFLIGGGSRSDKVYAALLINGKEVRRSAGSNTESMRQAIWHVGQYAGRKARILIADKASGNWGHINADDFRYGGRALVGVRYVNSARARRVSPGGP